MRTSQPCQTVNSSRTSGGTASVFAVVDLLKRGRNSRPAATFGFLFRIWTRSPVFRRADALSTRSVRGREGKGRVGEGRGGEGTVLSPNVDPESGLFSSTASSLPGHQVGKLNSC